MTTQTAFGPQGTNASTTLPAGTATNRYGTGIDTWVKDASSSTACDGTVLDAAFFNNIIGNMRYAIEQSGVTLNDGDMTLLYQALTAAQSSVTVTTNDGISITQTGSIFNITVELGTGNITFYSS